jgi:hypothetical protein
LQAREGVEATGGGVGSRIILDGSVFLKDDGFIDPTDLYQQPETVKAIREEFEARRGDAKYEAILPASGPPIPGKKK